MFIWGGGGAQPWHYYVLKSKFVGEGLQWKWVGENELYARSAVKDSNLGDGVEDAIGNKNINDGLKQVYGKHWTTTHLIWPFITWCDLNWRQHGLTWSPTWPDLRPDLTSDLTWPGPTWRHPAWSHLTLPRFTSFNWIKLTWVNLVLPVLMRLNLNYLHTTCVDLMTQPFDPYATHTTYNHSFLPLLIGVLQRRVSINQPSVKVIKLHSYLYTSLFKCYSTET